MPSTDVLKQLALKRNPFCDRTAEKTHLDPAATYVQSDIYGFSPSSTTYLYFGRRGAGKTTIRLFMQEQHTAHNEKLRASGSSSKGLFMIDLTHPSTLTHCLKAFMANLGYSKESWDTSFSQGSWGSADFADCLIFAAITDLMDKLTGGAEAARTAILTALQSNPRLARLFLVMTHVYCGQDPSQLAAVRAALLPRGDWVKAAGVTAGVAVGVAGLAVAAPGLDELLDKVGVDTQQLASVLPDVVTDHPKVFGSLAAVAGCAAGAALYARRQSRSLARAAALQASVRVVLPPPSHQPLATVLDTYFKSKETIDAVRTLCVGVHAFQKLELLTDLAKGLGYEDVAIFIDGMDEVGLLDPVQYPAAIKAFAASICKNEVLNHGRVHAFFPDSRQGLDLNTEKVNREARFDRHHVRDLNWSRHQLEELAERRFRAAQGAEGLGDAASLPSFTDLFKHVKVEDFSSFLSKLTTPRELMIMLSEILARAEASPDGCLTAQDMEFACVKATEQSV